MKKISFSIKECEKAIKTLSVHTFVIFWFTHIIKYQIESSQSGKKYENKLRFTNLRQDDNLSGRTITSQAGR